METFECSKDGEYQNWKLTAARDQSCQFFPPVTPTSQSDC